MGRFRYSLLSLLGLVTLLAVAFGALVQSTRVWAAAVGWVSVVVLVWAAVRAYQSCGSVRAFWFAFLFLGSGYLLVVFPTPGVPEGHGLFKEPTQTFLVGVLDLDDTWVPEFLSVPDRVLQQLHERLPHRTQVPAYTVEIPEETGRARPAGIGTTYVNVPFQIHFRRIGHWFITLLLAYTGGLTARWLYMRREKTA